VSVDDLRDLGERMDDAFSAITPAPAPVEGAVRRGTRIRWRRRLTAAASVAAVVAAGVFVPLTVHWQASPARPTGPSPYTVTVQPPGAHSPAGEIATGTIDGKRWQISATWLGTKDGKAGEQCFQSLGAMFDTAGGSATMNCGTVFTPDSTNPVSFEGGRIGAVVTEYGAVETAVSYVTITLSNGGTLTLHPVKVHGTRYVAFAAPPGTVIEATAYSRTGEIASAISFDDNAGMASFVTWFKPGQRGLARASGRIGSGTTGGGPWSATAYTGPWGVCVGTSVGGYMCAPATYALRTEVIGSVPGNTQVVVGSATGPADRLVVTVPGGTTLQVRPVAVGGAKFFAFAATHNMKKLRWTAYDAAGKVVGTGGL
jgi:hypothetical protein